MDSDESYDSESKFILLYICWHVDETMCKIKTWLFQFFLIVSPTIQKYNIEINVIYRSVYIGKNCAQGRIYYNLLKQQVLIS